MAVWSIVKRNEIERTSRMDPEYYQPEYLALDKELLSGTLRLTDIRDISSFVKKGIFDISPDKYIDHGIPLIRVQNIRSGFLSYNNMVFISETDHLKNKKTELTEGDLVLSKVGTIGEVAIISTKDGECNCSQNTIGVKVNKKKIKSEYLLLYFLSNLGQLQLQRSQMFQVQSKLELEDIRDLKVVLLTDSAQEEFRTIVAEIIKLRENSEEIYSQAERMLLDELGLKDLDLKDDLFYTTTLKDVNESNRMDAEYFMAKYEVVEKELDKFKHLRLDQICSHINYGTVPTSPYVEEGTPYIKGLNLVDCFIDVTKLDKLDRDTTRKLSQKFYVKENDIVISQMGTVGKAGIVQKEQEGWLFASFTIRVRLKKDSGINPHYLTLFIEKVSRPYYLLRKIAHASVRQNTDLPTIKGLKVPLLDDKTQTEISRLLTTSYEQKKEGKFLLDQAIRKVEGMIEKEAGRT